MFTAANHLVYYKVSDPSAILCNTKSMLVPRSLFKKSRCMHHRLTGIPTYRRPPIRRVIVFTRPPDFPLTWCDSPTVDTIFNASAYKA
jgi:hypothetical protein